MAGKKSRRDFLFRQRARHGRADDAGRDSEMPAPPQETPLLEVSRRAMATRFQVFFNAGQYPQATEAALDALDLLEPLEEQLSYFRPGGELSRINRLAAEAPVEVEPRLFGLLELAQRLSAETEGALDITSTPLWKVWGFSRRSGRVPSENELREARRLVGSHLVELDPERKTVRFREPGVELNLGSIGKGYALDRCAERLAAAEIGDFLFHGGQSSVLARGSRLQPTPGAGGFAAGGWNVGIAHPLRRGVRLAEIRLRDRALGTSSCGVQFFRHQGRRYGHILDPRTGWPAEGVLSATVLAPTAAAADALATAFFVLGVDQAAEFCHTHPELSAVLVTAAAQGPGVEVRPVGLAEGELKVLAEW